MKKTTWIVLANSSKAMILDDGDGKQMLTVVRVIANPEGRANARDLVTDRPSRPQSSSGERSALASRVEPHRNAQEHFARELADELDAALRKNEFGNLIIASSQPFLGILLNHFSHSLQNNMRKSVPRDMCDLRLEDVRAAIAAYETPSQKHL